MVDEKRPMNEKEAVVEEKEEEAAPAPQLPARSGGGWGGWGLSAFSVISDLQKAATVAAEEISRNASEVAKTAAKSIVDLQIVEDSVSSKEDEGTEESSLEKESEDENEVLRKSSLDKLEKASEDSFLGQHLKVLDNSVESFASGAWQALGSAWKGGTNLVQKIEHSAVNLTESVQPGGKPASAGAVAPSLIETGKAFTTKGMQVLEFIGKETFDLLITETGIDVEKNSKGDGKEADEDQLFEEVTFDRCFYIYGGPEQLEELEALSSHYALLFNRRKVKLPSDQKSVYDGKLRQVQQVFELSVMDGTEADWPDKGKKIETGADEDSDEMKNLRDSSVSKAAEMAAGLLCWCSWTPSQVIISITTRID